MTKNNKGMGTNFHNALGFYNCFSSEEHYSFQGQSDYSFEEN